MSFPRALASGADLSCQADGEVGIHKHFHLMSLCQSMLDGGYINPRSEHTKPKGIWHKLDSLYNLEALDEREDARQLDKLDIPRMQQSQSEVEESSSADDDADAYSDAANKIENDDFDLPNHDFAREKWERRLEPGRQRRDSSPMLMADINLGKEPPVRFTPSFSIEPSVLDTPASRKNKSRASLSGARGRGGAVASSSRRSMRKAESVAEEEEESAEADEDDGEGDEASEEPGSEQSTPAPRNTRSSKPARGRPAARARGRGRGK